MVQTDIPSTPDSPKCATPIPNHSRVCSPLSDSSSPLSPQQSCSPTRFLNGRSHFTSYRPLVERHLPNSTMIPIDESSCLESDEIRKQFIYNNNNNNNNSANNYSLGVTSFFNNKKKRARNRNKTALANQKQQAVTDYNLSDKRNMNVIRQSPPKQRLSRFHRSQTLPEDSSSPKSSPSRSSRSADIRWTSDYWRGSLARISSPEIIRNPSKSKFRVNTADVHGSSPKMSRLNSKISSSDARKNPPTCKRQATTPDLSYHSPVSGKTNSRCSSSVSVICSSPGVVSRPLSRAGSAMSTVSPSSSASSTPRLGRSQSAASGVLGADCSPVLNPRWRSSCSPIPPLMWPLASGRSSVLDACCGSIKK